jgi:zinc protease
MKHVLVMIALAACGPKQRVVARDAPVPWDASGVDWTMPPALDEPVPFSPAIEETALGNGVRIVVLRNARLPIVAVSAVIDGAGSRADRDSFGIAALTADMLDEGSGQRDSSAIQRELELAGTHHEIRIATDAATIQLVTRDARAIMPLLADMIRRPRFEDASVTRVRQLRLAEVAQRRDRVRTIAAQIFDRVTFGAHPYGVPAEGVATTLATLTAADLRAFWQRTYVPSAVTLIFAGDITSAEVRRLAEAGFGDWKQAASPSPAPSLTAFAPQLAFVEAPGAAQSVVLIGGRAAAAGDAQQLAADVASSIVGGGIGARLDRKLHEQLALTVGASASFWRGRWAGSWALATTFATDKTLTGIRAALDVIEQARTSMTDEELARAKADLVAAAQQSFETNAGTARALERIVAQGLPTNWYATYAARLDALTLEQVQAAASWRDLAVVIVGDWVKLGTQVGELGLPIVQYDRDGTRKP